MVKNYKVEIISRKDFSWRTKADQASPSVKLR